MPIVDVMVSLTGGGRESTVCLPKGRSRGWLAQVTWTPVAKPSKTTGVQGKTEQNHRRPRQNRAKPQASKAKLNKTTGVPSKAKPRVGVRRRRKDENS